MAQLQMLAQAIKGNKRKLFASIFIATSMMLWNFVLAPLAVAHGLNTPIVTLDTFVDISMALLMLI